MRSGVKKGKGRHAHRDSTLILLIYRHGLRVAEASALQWTQIDFNGETIYVKRVKIQHTVRYTELASTKFQGLWDG